VGEKREKGKVRCHARPTQARTVNVTNVAEIQQNLLMALAQEVANHVPDCVAVLTKFNTTSNVTAPTNLGQLV
jgi:hypothetical protein